MVTYSYKNYAINHCFTEVQAVSAFIVQWTGGLIVQCLAAEQTTACWSMLLCNTKTARKNA
jgi:hypothetical protein